MKCTSALLWASLYLADSLFAHAQTLPLPARPASALSGKQFSESIQSLDLQKREEKIFLEITRGNVPDFLRKLSSVSVTNIANGKTNLATFFVTPDYCAIGSNEDYFLTPMTPFTAQKIADALDCVLPTRKMANLIHSNALVKLPPSPISPSPAMTTVPIFQEHNETVRRQRTATLNAFALGALTAGHKKDVVISSQLALAPGKVAIYGWHRPHGTAIQPLYLGHAASWVDYSHGVRLVQRKMVVNGATKTVEEVLTHPELSALLSDEGIIAQPKYVFAEFPKITSKTIPAATSTNKNVPGASD